MEVKFAEKCAWRAVYVYVAGGQVFRLGVNPQLFGAVIIPRTNRPPLLHWRWRFGPPRAPWPPLGCRLRGLRLRLYQASSRFWSRVDGRRRA